MERKCAACAGAVLIDKDNSNKAIQYKKKFYHFDCFTALCDQKIANKRTTLPWTDIKLHIDDLVQDTTNNQQNEVAKDEIARWIIRQYNISYISNAMFIKLSDIYKGTLRGLAYPIAPTELFDEWQYYWDELCAIRQNKTLVGEQAINYDLAILLNRNAEYRRIKEREKIAQEIRLQQKAEELVINSSVMKTRRQPKNKIADLYKELNGGEDNE